MQVKFRLTFFSLVFNIKYIEKVTRKRSIQLPLIRENGSSAERLFEDGIVEGSF